MQEGKQAEALAESKQAEALARSKQMETNARKKASGNTSSGSEGKAWNEFAISPTCRYVGKRKHLRERRQAETLADK